MFSCLPQLPHTYLQYLTKALGFAERISVGDKTLTVLGELGSGGSADVLLVEDDSTPPNKFALKKMMCGTDEKLKQAELELELLRSALHPGIVTLLESSWVNVSRENCAPVRAAYMLLPLYRASLWDLVHERLNVGKPLDTTEILQLLQQVVDAVVAIHDEGYVHRDIKPQNVLVQLETRARGAGGGRAPATGQWTSLEPPLLTAGSLASAGTPTGDEAEAASLDCALTDFGSACREEHLRIRSPSEAARLAAESEDMCSPLYKPPELYDVPNKAQLDGRIDTWAIGCLLHFCMLGFSPFELESMRGGSLVLLVHRARIIWEGHFASLPPNPELQELVNACLRPNFQERPTSRELSKRIRELQSCVKPGTPR